MGPSNPDAPVKGDPRMCLKIYNTEKKKTITIYKMYPCKLSENMAQITGGF